MRKGHGHASGFVLVSKEKRTIPKTSVHLGDERAVHLEVNALCVMERRYIRSVAADFPPLTLPPSPREEEKERDFRER